MLTIPKTKDLVNRPTECYNEILTTLQNSNKVSDTKKDGKDSSSDDSLMQDELRNFLNEIKKPLSNNDDSKKNNNSNNNSNMFESANESSFSTSFSSY